MERLETAILQTVLYADVFNFPMTVAEIHHFLIHDEPVSRDEVEQTLAASLKLRDYLECQAGYVVLAGNSHLIAVRTAREAASRHLWPLARRYGKWLARLPFVRMVAVTGALAMRNAAHQDDDLDYLLVTANRRVWFARAFSILLVRLARLRGIEICPNYIVAENALKQERQNIFIAHEVAQMVPLYGCKLYEQIHISNGWVSEYLPNTNDVFYAEDEYMLGLGWTMLKALLEGALAGKIGDWFENWEYQRKLRRFARDLQTPHAFAKLDNDQIKGHFNDHGYYVLQQYDERIRQYGLEPRPVESENNSR